MDDLTFSSATTLAQAIKNRELSSREMVEAHLRRIEEVNPRINAVVQLRGDAAQAQADAADAAMARGETLGPLHGLPMTIKDSLDTEGRWIPRGSLAPAAPRAGRAWSRHKTLRWCVGCGRRGRFCWARPIPPS